MEWIHLYNNNNNVRSAFVSVFKPITFSYEKEIRLNVEAPRPLKWISVGYYTTVVTVSAKQYRDEVFAVFTGIFCRYRNRIRRGRGTVFRKDGNSGYGYNSNTNIIYLTHDKR